MRVMRDPKARQKERERERANTPWLRASKKEKTRKNLNRQGNSFILSHLQRPIQMGGGPGGRGLTVVGRAYGLRVTHSDPYALQKARERESERASEVL